MADKPTYKLVNDILATGELFELHGSRAVDKTGRILGGEFLMFAYERPPCGMQSVVLFAVFHVMQQHALYGVDIGSTAYTTGIDAALRTLDMMDSVLHHAVEDQAQRPIMRSCTYRDDVKDDEQLVPELSNEIFDKKVLVAPHLRSNPAHPMHAFNPYIPELASVKSLRTDGAVDDDEDDEYYDEHDNIAATEPPPVEVPKHDSPGQLPADLVFTQSDVAMIEGCHDIFRQYYANDRWRLMDVLSAVVMSLPSATLDEFDMGAVHANFLMSRRIREDVQQRAEDDDDDDSDDSDDFGSDDAD